MAKIGDIIENFYKGIYLDDIDLLKLNRWARKAADALGGGGPHYRIVRSELRRMENTTENWIQSRQKI